MPSLWDALRQYLRDAGPGGVLNPEVTPQGLLDTASLASAPVPIAGDIIGLLADANRMRDPSERTATNFGLMALGALPLVPSGLGKAKKALSKIDDAKRAKTKYEIAHEVAQRNAALPFEKGGLGLPPNNTAMDRAKAMGFDTDTPLYHGTSNDFPDFHTSSRQKVYLTDDPAIADIYAVARAKDSALRAKNAEPNVLPLYTRATKELAVSDRRGGNAGWLTDNLQDALGTTQRRGLYDVAGQQGYDRVRISDMMDLGSERQTQFVIPDPRNIRSRFAAFDPMKRDSADLLASIAPYAITGGLLGLLGLPDDAQAGK